MAGFGIQILKALHPALCSEMYLRIPASACQIHASVFPSQHKYAQAGIIVCLGLHKTDFASQNASALIENCGEIQY
jgi:hypothetical protein